MTVDDLRSWATSRIKHCERKEEEAGPGWIVARHERRTLETVLRILDGAP